MRIAVLMTVHNRCEKTLRCLGELYSQTLPEGVGLEVWLTDDGCTDGTPEAVGQQYPEVHIVKGDGNLFWNRGMCRAWDAAAEVGYDAYLWLNDDTYANDDMVASLLSLSEEKQGQAIIVGATCSVAEPEVLTYAGRNGSGLVSPEDGLVHEVEYFNGNIVLVPSAVYEKLGGLDPYFAHSKGDFEYGFRARKAGIHVFQCDHFLGRCDNHDRPSTWCDPAVPLAKRWKVMNSPLGMPPRETYHLERMYLGVPTAAFHYCTVILRCLFPKLWKGRMN